MKMSQKLQHFGFQIKQDNQTTRKENTMSFLTTAVQPKFESSSYGDGGATSFDGNTATHREIFETKVLEHLVYKEVLEQINEEIDIKSEPLPNPEDEICLETPEALMSNAEVDDGLLNGKINVKQEIDPLVEKCAPVQIKEEKNTRTLETQMPKEDTKNVPKAKKSRKKGDSKGNEKNHVCNSCGKTYSREFYLTRHMLSHFGEKPFPCKTCDKKFVQKANLIQHMKVHTVALNKENNQENEAFNDKYNCQQQCTNMRKHLDESTQKCNLGSSVFHQKGDLPGHIRTNTREKHKLVIPDIGELLEGWGLKTPMHPKRMRMWQPSNLGPPPPTPSAAPPTPSLAPPTPSVAPPTPLVAPPTPSVAPPTPLVAPPTPSVAPPTPSVAPPTPSVAPPTPSVAPPTPSVAPPTPWVAPPTPWVAPPTPSVAPLTPWVAPPTPSVAPPTPSVAPPTPSVAPPTPSVAPPTPWVAPPTPSVAPPTPSVAPPTPWVAPPTPSVAPPTPLVAPPTPSVAPPTPLVAPPTPSVAPPTPLVAPPTPSVAPPTPSVAPPTPSVAPPSPSPSSVPSPEIYAECESDSNPLPASPKQHPSPPPPPPRPQHLRDGDTNYLMNDGSDDDCDESDDEEVTVFPGIPRVFQSFMETPLDQDEDAAEDFAPAADPAPAGDSAPADTATDQPRSWYDFDWKEFPIPSISPESRRETFSENNVGPTTPRDDPYDIFVDIWDRQIMEHIASETNRYAQQVAAQMLENHMLHPRSRIARWYDTTVNELYCYFAIILAMGIVFKTRMEEYWSSTPDLFHTPGFSAHMSFDRFLLLNKCLHFNNNDDMCAQELDCSEAKLFKIQPILSHLNKKFQELYTPAQNIALDESLLMWKGGLEMSQLIQSKGAQRSIQSYEICESQTGYLWRFEIHAHKKTIPQQIQDPLEASTPSNVLRLTKGLENKGYTLWMDSYYNSPCLARRLKSLGFDCVGTLRTDRKFVPQDLHCLTKRNMRPGQIAGRTSRDVDIMVWRDTNRVAMISTYHSNGQCTVRGSTKPILILDYNIMMGGVDKKDQLLAMYPVERKRTKVWYKKLFRRLLNISVLNSYIIHRHSSSISHRNFRINLIKSLLSKHSTPTLLPAPTQNQRFDVMHRLAELPMRNHQRLRRACTVCKNKVRTYCVGCGKTVCMEPCFLTCHS